MNKTAGALAILLLLAPGLAFAKTPMVDTTYIQGEIAILEQELAMLEATSTPDIATTTPIVATTTERSDNGDGDELHAFVCTTNAKFDPTICP